MAAVCAAGQWVIISTNGEKRLLKVEPANKVVIDHARISALELVGIPFGAVLKSAGSKVWLWIQSIIRRSESESTSAGERVP